MVVSVDVGNTFNAIRFINKEGKVLGGCAKLNNREGFEHIAKAIEGVRVKNGVTYSRE